jgi:hypothetical protein
MSRIPSSEMFPYIVQDRPVEGLTIGRPRGDGGREEKGRFLGHAVRANDRRLDGVQRLQPVEASETL